MKFLNKLLCDLKSTLFDRDVIILLIAGPIALTLLFGGVYINDYIEDIPVAVFDQDNSSMSRMIIQQFNENERFNVENYVQTEKELEDLINARKVHMGIYIPPHFSNDISTLKSSKVIVIVDGTNIVVGNNAYAQAASIVQSISAGVEMKLLQAKDVVPQMSEKMAMPFMFNDRILYDPKLTYMNYLILGFVAVFLQQVMLSGVGISLIKKGEKIARDNTISSILSKIIACAVFAISSDFIAIWICKNIFNVPIRGNLLLVLALSIMFTFAISCPAIILASIVKDKLKFAQIAFMLSLPTFATSGYLWTIDQLPTPLVIGSKILWPLIYFQRAFDEILIKGLTFSAVKNNIIQMSIYILIWMPISIILFKKRFGYKENLQTKTE